MFLLDLFLLKRHSNDVGEQREESESERKTKTTRRKRNDLDYEKKSDKKEWGAERFKHSLAWFFFLVFFSFSRLFCEFKLSGSFLLFFFLRWMNDFDTPTR